MSDSETSDGSTGGGSAILVTVVEPDSEAISCGGLPCGGPLGAGSLRAVEGSLDEVKARLSQLQSKSPGGEREYEEPQSFTALHELYRSCHRPLDLYDTTSWLLKMGVPVNFIDDPGSTSLSYMVLHINRGLRYHMYRIPQLAKLEDSAAPRSAIMETCAELDAEYQEQVYKCLRLLLQRGADPNIIPATCPGIPFDCEWSENYEHKIMQSDQRWNLFTFGGSMEFTTYSIFNPLSRHRPTNSKGVTVLHLAAWRGDSQCLELLLEHGADVTVVTTDGRNTLHFLYLYCNNPSDLLKATKVLLSHGVNVNAVDSQGHTPLLTLLNHFLVKHSHVKYLANSYSRENIIDPAPDEDNYTQIIRECIDLLVESGASLDQLTHDLDTPLHYIYGQFDHSLRNCEPDFQVRGHYLVPYQFRLDPLIEFSKFLIERGCKVNTRDSLGRTPLHRLVYALKNLSLNEDLNSSDKLLECYQILLDACTDNVAVNAKDYLGRTPIHLLVEAVCLTRHSLQRHLRPMKLLMEHGADLRKSDNHGNTVLHVVLGSNMKSEQMQELLVFLLQCGANPDQKNTDQKYPLNNLMRQHIHHHDPLYLGGVPLRLDPYLCTMDIVCRAMSPDAHGYVFATYRESGFWGVICEDKCEVYRLLHQHCHVVTSLKSACRLVVWRSMGKLFWRRWDTLPLPNQIKRYVFEVVS